MAKRISKEEEKNEVLILTNGKDSEQNYFNFMKSKYISPYKIKVTFLNGAPDYLVRHAIDIVNKYNKIFVVTDVDQFQKSIEESYNLIQRYKNKIFLIISNFSFEVWLINHYRRFNNYAIQKTLEQDLTAYLNSLGYTGQYDKTDKEQLEKFFINNLLVAASNAKIAYQLLIKDFITNYRRKPKELELISSTMIYRLVEELHLEKKK